VLRKVRREVGRRSRQVQIQVERLLLKALGAVLFQEAVFCHLPEDDVAALAGALRVAHRIVTRRPLQHADEQRSLRRTKPGGTRAEVRLRRCLDAEGVVTEGHRIQVHLQDLALRVLALHLDRR
jgi:hypothetical protein